MVGRLMFLITFTPETTLDSEDACETDCVISSSFVAAGAGVVFSDSFDLSETSFAEITALVAEAGTGNLTTEGVVLVELEVVASVERILIGELETTAVLACACCCC